MEKSANLFRADIYDWNSWGKIFQSVEAFSPLAERIFTINSLTAEPLENCKPGTNAVFKSGDKIVKIFAPKQSGVDPESDFRTELFGLKRAERMGVPSPRVLASGKICDKYEFYYLVLEYLDGQSLRDIENNLSYEQKYEIGRKLRAIADKLNTPCEAFNDATVLKRGTNNKRWDKFPGGFNRERLSYIERLNPKDWVYVHGDINSDNLLLTENLDIRLIDFADALIAPVEYEYAGTAVDLRFEQAYMRGFFGTCDAGEIADICTKGLMMHDFGADIIWFNIEGAEKFESADDLRRRLHDSILAMMGKGLT